MRYCSVGVNNRCEDARDALAPTDASRWVHKVIEINPTRIYNTTGIGFMRTEVSLGLLFARLAMGAGGPTQKRDRNRVHAQAAYESLLKFLPRLVLTAAESLELYGGADQIRLAIAAIPI
jgi:hypothetical protein